MHYEASGAVSHVWKYNKMIYNVKYIRIMTEIA